MSKDTILHHYMVGDPKPPEKRGFDKFGYVHCLVWGMIYKKGEFFAQPNEHTLGIGGCGIGRVKSIKAGRKRLHEYIRARLTIELVEAKNLVRRIETALSELGDDPANIERFHVKDDRTRRPSDR